MSTKFKSRLLKKCLMHRKKPNLTDRYSWGGIRFGLYKFSEVKVSYKQLIQQGNLYLKEHEAFFFFNGQGLLGH